MSRNARRRENPEMDALTDRVAALEKALVQLQLTLLLALRKAGLAPAEKASQPQNSDLGVNAHDGVTAKDIFGKM